MQDAPNAFIVTIQRAFRRSGLSIKALSDRAGVPYASCYEVMKGERDPALSTAAKLSKVLRLELRPIQRKR